MTPARRAALAAGALLALCGTGAAACELVLSEHRSGLELMRLPLATGAAAGQATPAPRMRLLFTHSVLGTPVEDRYEWRREGPAWQAHLVEERFEGQGYGLPDAAEAGQRLERDGAATRLHLDRRVHPLVVRPLPALGMRVVVDGVPPVAPVWLGSLSRQAIEFRVAACAAH